MQRRWLTQVVMLLGLVSCAAPQWRTRAGAHVSDIDAKAQVIRLHLRNGELYVLSSWLLEDNTRTIIGTGSQLSSARVVLRRGSFRIPLASVAHFESNRSDEPTYDDFSSSVTIALATAAVVFLLAVPVIDDL